MRVTFTNEVWVDGITYLAGQSKTVPDDLATSFIASGWATPYEPSVIKEKKQWPDKGRKKPA